MYCFSLVNALKNLFKGEKEMMKRDTRKPFLPLRQLVVIYTYYPVLLLAICERIIA